MIITKEQVDQIIDVAMSRQTSLTSPADKVSDVTRFDITPSLIPSEIAAAKPKLVIPFFRPVERKFIDPPIPQQNFCIHSFVPAKGATPDPDGVFGMIKCRGTFNTLEEADQRSTEIIEKVDSIHKCHIAKVGHPFPMTLNAKFASEQKEIDLKEKTEKVMVSDLKEQSSDKKKEIQEIKEREKMLLQDAKSDNPLDTYIMNRVKRAQLVWTYLQNTTKLKSIFETIKKTEQEILGADIEHPEFKDDYKVRYTQAREESGIPDEDDSFIRYLDLSDVKLPKIVDCE